MATAKKAAPVKKTAAKKKTEVIPAVDVLPEPPTEITIPAPEVIPADNPAQNISGLIIELPIVSIDTDPDQPRKNFDVTKLRELGASIRHEGQLMPVRVSEDPDNDGKYLLEDGERRYQACKMAGITTIRAVVVPASVNGDRLVRQMSANTGEPLTPMETANGYLRLTGARWSTDKIARSFGVSEETVKLDLKLCECIPEVQDAVDKGGFSKSVARQLSELDPAKQAGAFKRAVLCANAKKASKAVTAYLEQVKNDTTQKGISSDPDDSSRARKAWGALKSGFCVFKSTPFSNGKGNVLIESMKSQKHREDMQATAKDIIKAAQKILSDLDTYEAKVNQNKPAVAA
jgi:ParB family chromosome partitioning protein